MADLLTLCILISLLPTSVLAVCNTVDPAVVGVAGILNEERLVDTIGNESGIVVTSNDGVSDYRKWAQGDSRWGSLKLGSSSYSVSSSGCLVTSVAKLIIQAGLKDSSSFNVATLVNWLNSNSGFDGSGNMYWAKPATYAGMSNSGDLLSYSSYSSANYNSKLLDWIKQGYHLVINVNSGGHWIAVDEAKSLATGTIYIMDSLYSSANADITLQSRYSTFNRVHAYTGGTTASPNLTISFDANGGSCSTATKTVAPGSAIGTLPTPTREGYDFAGWYGSVNSGRPDLQEPAASLSQ